MIEAKKLAYADMLRYVGDPRFADAAGRRRCWTRRTRSERAAAIGAGDAARDVRAVDVRRPDDVVRAATRSISRRSIATATSCR